MSKKVIFQELCEVSGDIIQLMPFVYAFYAFEYPLFYNHHNHEGDVTIILFAMGIHQGDPLGRAQFALANFKVLRSIANHFPSCLFPSIIDDTHIIGPLSIISSTYEHFHTEFRVIGLFIQPKKCIAWSPYGLLLNFNTPS
jgi:hypothetical protein